jgi:hypothetical protein
MCATFQFKKQIFKPGKKVVAVGESGIVRQVWAGFARAEILGSDRAFLEAIYYVEMNEI